jgi:endonuclease/exonuclease/phosphatase family metal-dependent hydrolase
MTMKRFPALALLAALAACASNPPITREPAGGHAPSPLTIASWNLEFLAERDGAGCEPRTSDDYRAMRRIAETLHADVVAFQEAESVAAAARVFDPARYTIIMEARPGQQSGTCGGHRPDQPFNRQAVGFAIRKGLAFDRNPDVTALQAGNPNLRSGVDITLRPAGHTPLRLLAIHLKSGCFSGWDGKACATLLQQVPVVEAWIDKAASGPTRFAVLGDWNRRLAQSGDAVWARIDDGPSGDAKLRLADAGVPPACDPRYKDFIDHIVLDRRAAAEMTGFIETPYATPRHYSDHCPVSVTLRR